MRKKAAVFILLGQSNAVGHGIPMEEKDIIKLPLKNVFGLSRDKNQTYSNSDLIWQGYTSFGMNLAENQDNTYSLVNQLAKQWQSRIDAEQNSKIPDLYIVQIAIGAQGITEKYMWYPERAKKLIPGKLGTVDISLYPFTMHILSLIEKSFRNMNTEYEIIGVHWRGGEEDMCEPGNMLACKLGGLYERLILDVNAILDNPPIVFHKICCPDRAMDCDHSGKQLSKMNYINSVFDEKASNFDNVSVFDPTKYPLFLRNVRGNGLFINDAVHYTPEVNDWVAETILEQYLLSREPSP